MTGQSTPFPTADLARPDWTDVCAIARQHAAAVDREGRLPSEALEALKAFGALGLGVPAPLGGGGASTATLARMARDLGAACASTAMVFAMHQNQLACLVRHGGDSPWLLDFQRRIAAEGLLLASVTSEEGTGGRLRTSQCCVEPLADDRFRLTKAGSTISYGARADALLLTARAGPEAHGSDQVLVVLPREAVTLEAYRGWDALGLRGTESCAFHVSGAGDAAQILPVPFGQIAVETMVPNAHILWGAVWLGIAGDVVARTRALIRARMRARSEADDRALPRLAEMNGILQDMDARLRRAIQIYDAGKATLEAVEMVLVKTSLSEMALHVADMGLRIGGFSAYQNNSPYSLGRHLRDLYAAPLMINNEAILADAGRMLLVNRQSAGNFDDEAPLP